MSDDTIDGFHVFYILACGYEPKYEFHKTEKTMLEVVQKANEKDSSYRRLIVIEGTRLTFEPYEKVITWRIKDPE